MPSDTAIDQLHTAAIAIDQLRSVVRDQHAWIKRHLESNLHSRQYIPNGSAPGGNSWAVVEIPDWECRQKLDALTAALAEEQPRSLAVGQLYLLPNGWVYQITSIDQDQVSYRTWASSVGEATANTTHIQRFTKFIETTEARLIESSEEQPC